MATLLLTAVGNALGGPIGGAIGALAGRQVDSMLLGGRNVSGPRLKDLSVQTSSYGDALPLHFGKVRSAGSVIWSTELVEHEQKSARGKGRPSVTTYTYSASFAVAVASRPISGIGRVWADGNLVRGAAGDLKVGGTMRVHSGFGDQAVDPLLAQAEAFGHCPAYRGLAYVVFEDLQLSDFGNRIPSLTFEILADETECSIADICNALLPQAECTGLDISFTGFTVDQGRIGDTLTVIGRAVPISSWLSGETLSLGRSDSAPAETPLLPPPAAGGTAETHGLRNSGWARRREPLPRARRSGLRYYDIGRDYQPGLQRGKGRSEQGDLAIIDLPAALSATQARDLADAVSQRLSRPGETLTYRMTEIDPALFQGAVVRTPVSNGPWRIDTWEWQKDGVILQLSALPERLPATGGPVVDAGRYNPAADQAVTPTLLQAFELPWDGTGGGSAPLIFAAPSSTSAGWKGAALFGSIGGSAGDLLPLGGTGRKRAITGVALTSLEAASPLLLDRRSSIDVLVAAADLDLADASLAQLLNGANRALLGEEIIQFGRAEALGAGRWRLSQLLRGRGGTEWAIAGHGGGEPFALLDGPFVQLDTEIFTAENVDLLAIGLGDTEPCTATVACAGATLRPLSPVHGKADWTTTGSIRLEWKRRARGAWAWADEVDIPLNEEREGWDITLGDPALPIRRWTSAQASLHIAATDLPDPLPAGAAFHVRQIGRASLSHPLTIAFPA